MAERGCRLPRLLRESGISANMSSKWRDVVFRHGSPQNMWLYNEVYAIRNSVKSHAISDSIIYLYLCEATPTIEWLCCTPEDFLPFMSTCVIIVSRCPTFLGKRELL